MCAALAALVVAAAAAAAACCLLLLPLLSQVGFDRTYEMRGADRVWIRQYGNALDKRQATMQLCIGAASPESGLCIEISAAIIFRGASGMDYYKSTIVENGMTESDMWANDVFVRFQNKSWADSEYSNEWIEECYAKQVDTSSLNLLLCDNLNAQTDVNGTFKKVAKESANTVRC